MATTRIPMHKIIQRHRDTRGSLTDWFAEDAMAFFSTKLPESGLALGSRIAFVTRETGPDERSGYSVRSLDWNTGAIDTVGEFRAYGRREANAAARDYLLTA